MIYIDWGDVETSKRLQDGDVVELTTTDAAPGTTEFELVLAPHKKWWKGLQILDNTDGQIAFLEVQDNNKTAGPISVPSGDIQVGGKVVLWKAKTFGIHTAMYILSDLEVKAGKRVSFRWIAD
ncbi:MAG: hypothetical protein ACRDRM_02745 [Pseudonocardiaceae bacterium]